MFCLLHKYNSVVHFSEDRVRDAAAVLNQALSSATALDGDSLSAALGGLGEIADSPRGPWTFDGQSPRQTMYLRTVENSGDRLVNVVSADLGMQSQV